MMIVLMIGQLPKEAGGNYTTGAAKVVYELSKQRIDGIELHTFATNTKDAIARKNSEYTNQYIGYNKGLFRFLKSIISNPKRTYLEWQHFKKVDHQNPLRLFFYKTNIERAISLTNPDLIHVHSIGNVSATRFALRGKLIPILLTCHGIFYRGDPHDLIGRDRYSGNLPLCDFFTGLTEEARHEFTDILGITPPKYRIIPNGVDTLKFYYSEEWRIRIRREMGVNDDTSVFLTVASLQERKGQLVFIKFLEQLHLDYQYWLIGLGADKDTINDYIIAHRLEDKVKILGYRNSDELFRYYSAADVYAHTSWKEGQALSEIEAYSTGLRTLVNVSIKGTLIDNPSSEHYCLVNFDSPEWDSVLTWLEQGRNIKRVSMKAFDWSNIAKRYVSLYSEIIGR